MRLEGFTGRDKQSAHASNAETVRRQCTMLSCQLHAQKQGGHRTLESGLAQLRACLSKRTKFSMCSKKGLPQLVRLVHIQSLNALCLGRDNSEQERLVEACCS